MLRQVDWLSRINAGRPGAWSEFYNLAATPAGLPTIIAFTSGEWARRTDARHACSGHARLLAISTVHACVYVPIPVLVTD